MEELKLETNWQPPKTIWNPMFLSIFFANMALNMGQQMSNSLLSLYANSLGAPADEIGMHYHRPRDGMDAARCRQSAGDVVGRDFVGGNLHFAGRSAER